MANLEQINAAWGLWGDNRIFPEHGEFTKSTYMVVSDGECLEVINLEHIVCVYSDISGHTIFYDTTLPKGIDLVTVREADDRYKDTEDLQYITISSAWRKLIKIITIK